MKDELSFDDVIARVNDIFKEVLENDDIEVKHETTAFSLPSQKPIKNFYVVYNNPISYS